MFHCSSIDLRLYSYNLGVRLPNVCLYPLTPTPDEGPNVLLSAGRGYQKCRLEDKNTKFVAGKNDMKMKNDPKSYFSV